MDNFEQWTKLTEWKIKRPLHERNRSFAGKVDMGKTSGMQSKILSIIVLLYGI